MDEFDKMQFCNNCKMWVEGEYDLEIDVGFIHEHTAHLTAVRWLDCPECGDRLAEQTSKSSH